MNFFKDIWNINIQIVPITLLLCLYILPNELRKYKSLKYAPIYFAVPPFCNSNALINSYYECLGNSRGSDDNREKIIKKIKKSAKFSLLLEVCIWPVLFGGISGFIISSNTIKQLVVIILLIRLYQFTKSVLYFRKGQYYDKVSGYILTFIYMAFTYISLHFILGSYNWINNLVIRKDYVAIFDGIVWFILKDLILVSAVVYVGSEVFMESFFNKKGLGYANLYNVQNTYTKDDTKNNEVNKK